MALSKIAESYKAGDDYGFQLMTDMLAKAASKPLKECEQGKECGCDKCDAAAEKKESATLQ